MCRDLLCRSKNGRLGGVFFWKCRCFKDYCIWRSPAAAGAVVNGSGAVTAAAV